VPRDKPVPEFEPKASRRLDTPPRPCHFSGQ